MTFGIHLHFPSLKPFFEWLKEQEKKEKEALNASYLMKLDDLIQMSKKHGFEKLAESYENDKEGFLNAHKMAKELA